MCIKEFLQLNWLKVHDRYLQFIVSDIFKYQNDECPDYFDENIKAIFSENKNQESNTYPICDLMLVKVFPII